MHAADREPDGDVGQSNPASCVFCAPEAIGNAIAAEGTVYALLDMHPVTTGHTLIIPVRHTADFFTMAHQEQVDALTLLERLRLEMLARDQTVSGFNVGMNCGAVAGQTLPHAHIHLIPRRQGDTPRPRGGVRGVIPAKMDY